MRRSTRSLARRFSCSAKAGVGTILVSVGLLLSAFPLSVVLASPAFDSRSGTWKHPRSIPGTVPLDSAHDETRAESGASTWSFSPNVRVHPVESGQHLWPDVAVGSDGEIGVAWMDDHSAGGYHIFYSASSDAGATWSTPEKVDSRAGGAYSKFVDMEFTPSGIPVLVWEDDRTGSIQLHFSKRNPDSGGTPWTTNVRINTAGGSPSGSDFMNPSLAVLDDDRYFVAWTDWREGVFYQVYGRSTTDGGVSWGTETKVSDGLGFQPVAGDPCLIVDPSSTPGSETLYCVTNDWRGNVPGGRYPNVYFYRSTNGGGTWSVGVRVNDLEPYYQQVSSHALVRLDDGTLVAGWMNDHTQSSTHYRICRSTNEGATWESSVQVDQAAQGTDVYNSVAALGQTLFAVFGVYEGSWNAYFRASPDGGLTWDEPMVRVDDDASSSAAGNAVLAPVSSAEVQVVWQDNRTSPFNWKIYTARGTRDNTGVDASAQIGMPSITVSPNPARAGDPVTFVIGAGMRSLGTGGEIAPDRVRVLDASGRLVRQLRISGGLAVWDGRGLSGEAMSAGVYLVQASSAQRQTNQSRVVVVK
jgi:hypothetical protein